MEGDAGDDEGGADRVLDDRDLAKHDKTDTGLRSGQDRPNADMQTVLDRVLAYRQTVTSIVVSTPVPSRPLPVRDIS